MRTYLIFGGTNRVILEAVAEELSSRIAPPPTDGTLDIRVEEEPGRKGLWALNLHTDIPADGLVHLFGELLCFAILMGRPDGSGKKEKE